ncbi:hypothetical protein RMATCC62417_08036 [Rhizopus microsporus]|nr:hypothetical protein RMATCC62417_08036 [Rhizopus microsporus]
MSPTSLDLKNKFKYDELKKRCRAIEEENELLEYKLSKANRQIKRLRLEKSLLLEKVDRLNNDYSDSGSETMHNGHHEYVHEKHRSDKLIKPKKKKDPNAPKGPGNVFFLFCRMERDKMKVENPEESIGDITRLLALKWKALTKEEKKYYYDTFKKEMEEHEEAMKSYKEGLLDSSSPPSSSDAQSPHIHDVQLPTLHQEYLHQDIINLNTDEQQQHIQIHSYQHHLLP